MEELRLAFLVLGAFAIAGILIHGLWSVRKNANKEKQTYEPRDWSEDGELDGDSEYVDSEIEIDVDDPLLNIDDDAKTSQFDDLGLGEVRVINKSPEEVTPEKQEVVDVAVEEAEVVEEEPGPKIYSSVVTQPKPEYVEQQAVVQRASVVDKNATDDIPEPPPSLLKKAAESEPETPEPQTKEAEPQVEEPKVEKATLAEQAKNLVKRKKAEPKGRKRREPKIREDQMKIDFDEPDPIETPQPVAEEPLVQQQEVLVLNVKADDDKPIPGSALLPMLLTLGFKFGDQDIFHRHVNSNGKGPVLFSLANMFKPGVFDIDNLENFTTQGISLFMILPIEGDPHQVFNMMHNAARKIADEFSAQVLDGRRCALNKQSLQQYVEKIREFERQRMIAR